MGQGSEIVDRFWEIMESGDVDRLPEIWTEDTEFTMPGVSFRGIEPMKALREMWWSAFPDLHHETVDCVESDAAGAYEIKVNGTHQGAMQTPAGELPATGKHVSMPSMDYIKFKDGKVVSWHAYPDMMGLMAQIGNGASAAA